MEPITFIILAVIMAISAYLTPKPKNTRAGQQKVQLPTAEEGKPYPVLFGCRMIRGVNAISSWLYLYTTYVTYHDETAANLYYGSFHLGVCQTLDGVKQIWWGGKCAWPKQKDPDTYEDDGETTAIIQAKSLWGSWAYGGPGGVDATVDILYGEDNQTLNSYLEDKLGTSQPYYRGFVSMVFRGPTTTMDDNNNSDGAYIGTSPQLRPIAILGKRTDQMCDHSAMWYPAKAAIGTYNDMNPIHMIYEWLTSSVIGRGCDTDLIGDSFETVADALYTEGFGLSCVWDYAPDDIDSMINKIEEIVDGKLYFDYSTGKYEFGLNRPDYVEGDLTTYDESDFWIESASYLSPGNMPSKVIVSWEHRQYDDKRVAYDDDIALLARQNGIVNVQEFDYTGFVCDGDLANDIASRMQYMYSSMPKRYVLRCLRTMADLNETDVIKISYPALNITSMILRIVSIDRGSLTDGECIIECLEDVFGYEYTVYGTPPEPANAPADLESNITGDELIVTESVTIVIDYGINRDDDLTVEDYEDINII